MAKDGKIKRTSFARRVAPQVFVCTLFLRRAELSNQRSAAPPFSIFPLLSMQQETAVRDEASAISPLLRHNKQVYAA
jgi:hypothetical protein